MATVKSFEDLQCWQNARVLCKEVGLLIDGGVFKRNYRLVHQLEGSSGSIMDNIAEGFERGSRAEFIVFLGYAKGSCGELRSQLYRSLDRNYINDQQFESFTVRLKSISGMLQRLIRYLNQSSVAGIRKKIEPKQP